MSSERLWELLAKKKSEPLTSDEKAELDGLLLENPGTVTNEIIDKVWETPMRSLPEMTAPDETWNRVQNTINAPTAMIGMRHWLAAAAIVGIICALAALYLSQKPRHNELAANVQNKVTTEPSSKTKIELPDGTQVWLNGNSQLVYNSENFGETNREVKLSGEAFFDVVKDQHHPFVIHTGAINITVKGTAFNVKAYPGQKNIETALIRGLIEITTIQDPERKILVRPNEKIIFPASLEAYKAVPEKKSDNSLYTITRLQPDVHKVLPETVWMNKKLEFSNETFEDIAPKLESWYAVTFHFSDEAITSKRFSGLIEKETLAQTLAAMRLSYPFHYQITGEDVWISK
jgi:ferric-dicitrate binding protein FerR (iron transport regulator)